MTLLGEFDALKTIPNTLYAMSMTYRRLTSNPNVEPRTYATAVNFSGFLKDHTHRDQWDDRRGAWITIESVSLVTDPTVVLRNGDQITDADGKKWAFASRDSSGPATIHYTLEANDPSLASGGDRGGGV